MSEDGPSPVEDPDPRRLDDPVDGLGDQRPIVALVAHAVGDSGGMERAMAELVERGCQHFRFVIVARDLDPSLQTFAWRWTRVRVPARPAPLRFAMFYLVAGLRLWSLKVDVVHTLGAIVPNRCDLASVHSCHAGSREKTGALAPREAPPAHRANVTVLHAMALVAERWSYRPGRARAIAVVSDDVGREIERHFPGQRVAVTPNGVDLERFAPSQETRAELRRAASVDEEDVIVLFVGGIWEHKGLHLVAEGIVLAQKQTATRLHLWILGSGDPEGIRAQSAFPRMTFFGRRTDAERFYAAADLLVLPSMYEAAPLVCYEAAASGVPIVATRVGGVTELVGEDEQCGIFVERSAESVSRAIARLASDPSLRAEMGAEGRRRASVYTWERSVATVTSLYTELSRS